MCDTITPDLKSCLGTFGFADIMIDLEEYFARIGYTGTTDVTFATLRDLHVAHVFSVPFENLALHDLSSDPIYPIKLDEQSLVNKIIKNKRGGNCYESNGLFALILIQLGFHVDRLMARVLDEPGTSLLHEVLLVTINKKNILLM